MIWRSFSGTPFVLVGTISEEFSQVEHAVHVRRIRSFQLKSDEEYIPVRNAVGTGSEIFGSFLSRWRKSYWPGTRWKT